MKTTNFIHHLFLSALVVVLGSCVPKATENKAVCGTNQSFSSVSRTCVSVVALRTRPTGTLTSATLSQETAKTLTLSYKDGNSDTAISCKIVSSSISSNIEPVSPQAISGVTDSAVILKAYTLLAKISALGTALPVGMEKTNLQGTYIPAMQSAYSNAKATFTYSNLISQLQTISDNTDSSLNDAISYTVSSASIRSVYNAAQTAFTDFKASKTSVENRCDCSGGVCTTSVAPRILQTGSAGFSYTITDVDGEGDARQVSLTIAATAKTTAYLAPSVESVYVTTPVFNESATSTPGTYTFTVPTTIAHDYYGANLTFNVDTSNSSALPTKGSISGCMGIGGASGTTCTYKPTSGDTNDGGVLPTTASLVIGDLTFTAKAQGKFANNNYSVQYFDLASSNNYLVDSYVTKAESYGLVSPAVSGKFPEAFVRVVGNSIRVFFANGLTTADDIKNVLTADVKASSLVNVTVGVGAGANIQAVSSASTAQYLTGGSDAFDSFQIRVTNGSTYSTNTATVMLRMIPTEDPPYHIMTVPNPSATGPEDGGAINVDLFGTTVAGVTTWTYGDVENNVDSCQIETTGTYDSDTQAPFLTNFTYGACTCNPATQKCSITVTPAADVSSANTFYFYYRIGSNGVYSSYRLAAVNVTPINDSPTMSITAAAPINENTFGSTVITTDHGGGTWETGQTLSMTLSSGSPLIVPNNTVCKDYTPGAGVPTGTPSSTSALYFDTTNKVCYQSNATKTGWILYPSLTAFPECAYGGNYGSGPKIGNAASGGLHYLDVTNNDCYVSALTAPYAWSKEYTTKYYPAYVPYPNKSAAVPITINVSLTDSSGAANATTTSSFPLTINYVDDPPSFTESISKVETNEGGTVIAGPFRVNEDAGDSVDEDPQEITLSYSSDNGSVLPASSISAFYDLNDNGVLDSGEARATGSKLDPEPGGVVHPDSNAHRFYLILKPVAGISGNANITLTANDGTNTTPLTFSLIVHPIAALHGGWANISAVGIKTDKNGAPASSADIQCNYNKSTDFKACNGGANCTNLGIPTATVTPDEAGVLYWDAQNKKCYRSTGTTMYSWVDFNTTCPVTRKNDATVCSKENCITSGTAPTVSFVGQYYYDVSPPTPTCYLSDATNAWIPYVPSKVTLTWNSFTVASSGADAATSIAGWNVYRREKGADYDIQNGFLNQTTNSSTGTKMSVTDPNVRTFTDTTAVAGKVYYYLVRPVDTTVRHLTISTPEVFSEVRVMAPTENYAFVHRWMVNQEVCNSMHMTTSTTNRVDPSHNYRCPYYGPGDDLGCNYTKVPTACSGGACTGISDPSGSISAYSGTVFYDSSADNCYKNTSASSPGVTWTLISSASTHYYDIGQDMLVDISESGCPYTPSPSCGVDGCIGIGDPVTTGASGMVADDIYYDRSAGSCYRYNGTTWTDYNTAAMTSALVDKTNTALNAPLVNISKAKASAICSTRSSAVPTANLTAIISSPQLPTKKEYIAYSAAPYLTSDSLVSDLEQGFSLNVQSRCNSSNANGIDYAFTDSTIPSTSFIYALPGTASSGIRSLYTGSVPWANSLSTESCSSRYGIQDVYGNVSEWVKDSVKCAGTVNAGANTTLTANVSISDPTITVSSNSGFPSSGGTITIGTGTGAETIAFTATSSTNSITIGSAAKVHSTGDAVILIIPSASNYVCKTQNGTDLGDYNFNSGKYEPSSSTNHYAFDLTTGPYNDLDGTSSPTSGDSFLTNWIFRDELFSAGKFAFPVGMPVNVDIKNTLPSAVVIPYLLDIGPTSGITTSQLHEDGVIINGAAVNNILLKTDTGNPNHYAPNASQIGSFAQGGSYLSGNFSGRYSSELVPDAVVRPDIGFRCYIPVAPVNYPADSFHPYTAY